MLSRWINKKYLNESEIRRISKLFKKAKPYPFFELKDFFNKEKLEEVKTEIIKEKFERHDKDLFSLSNTNELKFSNNKKILEFYNLINSKEFVGFVSKMTNQRLSHIDMHAHSMVQGDYLLFHDDVVGDRKIAYIIYISKGFMAKDGGRLQLFDIKNPRKPIHCIVPEFGTFAGFEVSDKSLHVVEEVISNKNRLTIGGWFSR